MFSGKYCCFIFRQRRKHEKVLSVCLFISIILLVSKLITQEVYSTEKRQISGETQSCIHPQLDPNLPEIMKFFKKLPEIKCNEEEDWIFVKEGVLLKSPKINSKYGNFECDYIPIIRGADDFSISDGPVIKNIQNGTLINSDFFRISCKSKKGVHYDNVHCAIAKQEETLKRSEKIQAPKNMPKLSVIMFGIDSVSHMTWLRMLPKSHKYFTKLGGLVLNGYNIVGDGTPQALLPILTGQTEWELPEARRGRKNASVVDGHPWIWKNFRDAGYVTQYGEDSPNIGTFTYRMLGFKKQPVDHYMRTYHMEAEKHYSKNKAYCLGSEKRDNIFLNWIKHFVEMYNTKPKFSFLFYSECSHGDNNLIQHVDNDLFAFLTYMKTSGHLDHTILILMADHGARFQNVRETVQGKLEERMPYFSFLFPQWFATKYPDAYKNFKTNTHRLTTPFDIHETFMHLFNFTDFKPGSTTSRGISLFKEIPKKRSCQDADIEPHWCACLHWDPVSLDDERIKKSAMEAVRFINSLTSKFRSECRELKLFDIKQAFRFRATEQLLKFKQSSDNDGRFADLSDKMVEKEYLIQVTFHVTPGNGLFEVTLKHNVALDTYIVKSGEISRINKYGSAPNCIASRYPNLRQYCYCVKQTN
ncbi:XP_029642003.1uncharacterized protein LOC115216652 [Octopus vulgaris]|uniref:XP_029642003.1uncharacterized protein LOC115216652 n=1 Tax=Octopus vulgaris TaxID=6645 RepID=A0AA36F8Q4_OCTVU|nr:XP_029642003.1uncharacterized protein LOC115216652 [Octopus vulgaris]